MTFEQRVEFWRRTFELTRPVSKGKVTCSPGIAGWIIMNEFRTKSEFVILTGVRHRASPARRSHPPPPSTPTSCSPSRRLLSPRAVLLSAKCVSPFPGGFNFTPLLSPPPSSSSSSSSYSPPPTRLRNQTQVCRC